MLSSDDTWLKPAHTCSLSQEVGCIRPHFHTPPWMHLYFHLFIYTALQILLKMTCKHCKKFLWIHSELNASKNNAPKAPRLSSLCLLLPLSSVWGLFSDVTMPSLQLSSLSSSQYFHCASLSSFPSFHPHLLALSLCLSLSYTFLMGCTHRWQTLNGKKKKRTRDNIPEVNLYWAEEKRQKNYLTESTTRKKMDKKKHK